MASAWTWVLGWKGNPVRRETQVRRRVQFSLCMEKHQGHHMAGVWVSVLLRKTITMSFLLTVRGQGRCRYSGKVQPLKGSHRVKKEASRLEQHSKRMLPGSGDILTAPFLLVEKPVFNSYLSKQSDESAAFLGLKILLPEGHGVFAPMSHNIKKFEKTCNLTEVQNVHKISNG